MPRVVMGADHAGYKLKEAIKEFLEARRYPIDDKGCHDDQSVDYPDYAAQVSRAVADDDRNMGILVCGTGIGMSIAANKVPGARAALCHTEYEAQMSRNHNNANVICLGARTLKEGVAVRLVEKFLRSEFEGDRHARRVDKIKDLETC